MMQNRIADLFFILTQISSYGKQENSSKTVFVLMLKFQCKLTASEI